MTNRIGGDWSSDALEAFRAAYGQQIMTPQDQDVTPSGLPGNNISNTSPWYEHVGIWKYPSGKGPDQDLQKPFAPDAYLTPEDESEEGEEEITEEEFDAYLDTLSLEELQSLATDLGVEAEEEMETTMSDEEVENLIAELNDD